MRTILKAIDDGLLDARATIVISNNTDSRALAFAAEHGIRHVCLNAQICGDAGRADAAICEALQSAETEFVVLSGYMKRIGPLTLAAFPERILNIHPSLLPQFGGQGMYGMRVHEAVIESGVKETGATVHIVDEVYDHGRMLEQVRVPVFPGDTPETIRDRVAAEEGLLYVKVLQTLARER